MFLLACASLLIGCSFKRWILHVRMFELDMLEKSWIFVLFYWTSSAITAAHMNAPTQGTDIAFPAILTTALSRRSSTQSLGDPQAWDCCLLIGKQCDANISVPLSTRWCTLQEMDFSLGVCPRSNKSFAPKKGSNNLYSTKMFYWLYQACEDNRPEFVVKVGKCPSAVSVLALPFRGSCVRSAIDHFLVTKFLSRYSFKVCSWRVWCERIGALWVYFMDLL